MGLDAYRARRDFAATPEPEDQGSRRRRGGLRFAIQKHAARRLHYDLRLEHGGVLWSWAVTRGPSLVAGDRRLAVRTEDHPLAYAGFEGVIPKGQYGAGAVLLWDRGRWESEGGAEKGLAKGHLEIVLAGERLAGRWHLVRMAARAREKTENWLLIKAADDHAREEGAPDVLGEHVTSVASGRTIEEVAAAASPRRPARTRRKPAPPAGPDPFPGFVPPALATLGKATPGGKRWLHEIKFDGYRLQAHVRGGRATLLTRTGLDWTARFGTRLAGALADLAEAAVLDGELVVEDEGGVSDFSALQAELSEGRADRFLLYLFDLLHLDGRDLRPLPLVERKAALEALLARAADPLRYSAHFAEEGEVMLRHACRLSLEGLVSKRRDDPYPGGRTGSWIKSKCLNRQEFVVLGFAPSTAQASAVGGLLLGVRREEGLVPVGRVGTGFTHRAAEDLFARLQPLMRKEPAFKARLGARTAKAIRFVEPRLVAEVEFLAWTRDGTLRHASFRGIREDKAPEEVVAETPAPVAERPRRKKSPPARSPFAGDPPAGSAAAASADPPAADPPAADCPARPPEIDRLTNPDKPYWPEAGVTKEALAGYYLAVWRRLAPHLADRPLALLRCPNGHTGHCFFQKHAWRGQSRSILRMVDPLDDGEDPSFVAIDSLPGLVGLVQAGSLELHGWQSTAADLERPDQIVMDLDPGEGVIREALVKAAGEVRVRLEAAGLAAFLKTTGGKGYHIVAPIEPRAGWAEVKAFSKGIADAMAADSPADYVATLSKARRRGRILIDYLRNGRGATAVAPYSTRARAGATVSMPIAWDELGADPSFWTVANAPGRVASTADPWAGFRRAAAPIPGGAARTRRKRRPAAAATA